jgi:hypothetical protein
MTSEYPVSTPVLKATFSLLIMTLAGARPAPPEYAGTVVYDESSDPAGPSMCWFGSSFVVNGSLQFLYL